MKIALVHDYIREYGGAERVLRVMADMFPQAPIYTAFRIKNSSCDKEFKNRKIIESRWAPLIKHGNLYSPLRFLIPWIWGSLDLSGYDLVITSCSSYIARGFKTGPKTKVIAYCHTPPKFLYGYETSINWQKYWPIKIYGLIINHFLRLYDFKSAQKVNYWIANSQNVKQRIAKFYRREAVVIYPPIEVDKLIKKSQGVVKKNYFLIASRLVGGKGVEAAALAAGKLGFDLKISGEAVGFSRIKEKLEHLGAKNVALLGRTPDEILARLYAEAKGFFALEKDVDFGMTPVEAMAAGTPVIAYNGGGFRESVIDGVTGILINDTSIETIKTALKRFNSVKWDKKKLQYHAQKFSKERFVREIKEFVRKIDL